MRCEATKGARRSGSGLGLWLARELSYAEGGDLALIGARTGEGATL
jgi:hypothetical protein